MGLIVELNILGSAVDENRVIMRNFSDSLCMINDYAYRPQVLRTWDYLLCGLFHVKTC